MQQNPTLVDPFNKKPENSRKPKPDQAQVLPKIENSGRPLTRAQRARIDREEKLNADKFKFENEFEDDAEY